VEGRAPGAESLSGEGFRLKEVQVLASWDCKTKLQPEGVEPGALAAATALGYAETERSSSREQCDEQ